MGFLSCNSESSIIACDPYNCSSSSATTTVNNNIKKKKKKSSASYKIKQFSYTDLETATDGFSPKCFLGKGSHGSVYKAVLNNGKLIVAVKRSTITTSSQEDNNNFKNKNDFCTVVVPGENEVEILSKIQNPRFVNLLGYSFDSNENKLIVVEYMPNGSLYDILHSNSLRPLHWAKRVRFALQIARAVDALHSANPPVIHRDIKSSNVLIDGNWNARLGDFGLALRGYVEDVRIKCTPPAGTLGYLDPGYIVPEDLTAKSDVFSFGILLLEIVSGRNAIDMNYSPPSVVDWALPLIKHGEYVALCDPRIDPPDDLLVIQQLAMLAAKCVRSMAEKRPAMAEVVECLRIVNKSMSSPLWSSFRKQPVEESSLSIKEEMCEDVVRTENHGYRTGSVMCDAGEGVVRTTENHDYRTGSVRNRIVSSIQLSLSVDFGKEITNKRVGIRVGRSNSIGSASEIKLGSDTGLVNNQLAHARVRRRSTVTVKMPYVKLYKSRSLGMLRSTCLEHSSERGFVLQLVKSPKLKGLDLSRLVRSVGEALETNIIEPKQST